MSRTLRFRCWDKVAGLYLSNGNWTGINQDGNPWLVIEGKDVLDGSDRWVVEQYTGLKDKNGKEIYEGDIVEYVTHYYGNEKRHRKVVEWGEWYSDDFGEPHNLGYSNLSEVMEVIGNIHENPELLGE